MKRLLLTFTLPLYGLDQLTKWLVHRFISIEEQIVVVPDFFYLVQVHNTGAAFGMLRNNNWFFIGLSILALMVLPILWRRGAFRDQWTSVGLALLISGILGNLTDRILHGYVTDFLLFDLHVTFANPWPAFNVADSCICVAASLFALGSLFEKKLTPNSKSAGHK